MEYQILPPDSATCFHAKVIWRYWCDMPYQPKLIREALNLNPNFPVLALANLLMWDNLPNPYSPKYKSKR